MDNKLYQHCSVLIILCCICPSNLCNLREEIFHDFPQSQSVSLDQRVEILCNLSISAAGVLVIRFNNESLNPGMAKNLGIKLSWIRTEEVTASFCATQMFNNSKWYCSFCYDGSCVNKSDYFCSGMALLIIQVERMSPTSSSGIFITSHSPIPTETPAPTEEPTPRYQTPAPTEETTSRDKTPAPTEEPTPRDTIELIPKSSAEDDPISPPNFADSFIG